MGGLGNKEVMAKNIKFYMDKNDIDRNKLCFDLGIKYTTLCDWLNAKTYPRIDKIEMMANYFNIQKSDLVEDNSNISILEGNEEENYYLNEDAREMAQFMFENPEYKVLFDASRKVNKNDIDVVKAIMDKFRTED